MYIYIIGTYSTQLANESPSFSFSGKTQLKESSFDSPGPGAYSYKSTIGQEAPSFSISGRVNEKSSDSTMGPGIVFNSI